MKLTFLGTGTSQGVPVIACECEVCRSLDYKDKRLRTSVLISSESTQVVIDTGPDFRQQMLRERVEYLDAVIYTHEHKDHTAGLDDVRSFNFKQNADMPVYGRKQVLEQIQIEFAYAFQKKKYPGVPKIKCIEIENKPFTINDIEFTPVEVMHHKLPVFGFKVKEMAYITDANFITEAEKDKLKGLKVLVINALQFESHISHFTVDEALELIEELKPQQAYLIHISHKFGLHAKVEPNLPENVAIAYDGHSIEF